jgi:hypothetical protein
MCQFSSECSSACTVKTEEANYSEMSVTVYQITCFLVSQCLSFYQLYCHNLSSLTQEPLRFYYISHYKLFVLKCLRVACVQAKTCSPHVKHKLNPYKSVLCSAE